MKNVSKLPRNCLNKTAAHKARSRSVRFVPKDINHVCRYERLAVSGGREQNNDVAPAAAPFSYENFQEFCVALGLRRRQRRKLKS